MADVTVLSVDDRPGGLSLGTWQLCKPLSTVAQTAVTAAKLSQSLFDVSFDEAFQVIPVSRFGKIAFQVWGVASNGNLDTLNFYGWHDNGSGSHIGSLAAGYGNFTSAALVGFHTNAHKSIMDEYAAGTAYRGVDTHLVGATGDKEDSITNYFTIQESDVPSSFLIDFTNSQYKYFGIATTTIGGTSNGVIFKPLTLRGPNPQRAVKTR